MTSSDDYNHKSLFVRPVPLERSADRKQSSADSVNKTRAADTNNHIYSQQTAQEPFFTINLLTIPEYIGPKLGSSDSHLCIILMVSYEGADAILAAPIKPVHDIGTAIPLKQEDIAPPQSASVDGQRPPHPACCGERAACYSLCPQSACFLKDFRTLFKPEVSFYQML